MGGHSRPRSDRAQREELAEALESQGRGQEQGREVAGDPPQDGLSAVEAARWNGTAGTMIGLSEANGLGDGTPVALAVAPLWRHSQRHTSGWGLPGGGGGSMMLGKMLFNNELRELLPRAARPRGLWHDNCQLSGVCRLQSNRGSGHVYRPGATRRPDDEYSPTLAGPATPSPTAGTLHIRADSGINAVGPGGLRAAGRTGRDCPATHRRAGGAGRRGSSR